MKMIELGPIGNMKQFVLDTSATCWSMMREELLIIEDEFFAVNVALERAMACQDYELLNALQYQDTGTMFVLSASWANHGYRRLTCSHKLAAAMMCTSISPDVMDSIQLPWPCFAIDIPRGLLYVTGGKSKKPEEVIFAIIRYGYMGHGQSKRYSHMLFANDPVGTNLYGSWDSVSETTRDAWSKRQGDDPNLCLACFEKTTLDDKATRLLWRLAIGLVVLSQNKAMVKPSKKALGPFNRREPGPPMIRSYEIRGTTTTDCRQAVQDYMLHTNKSPMTVQTLVSGHYRNQPYGQGHSLRKIIWIEPFWRGPEDAPVSVTSKRIDREKSR